MIGGRLCKLPKHGIFAIRLVLDHRRIAETQVNGGVTLHSIERAVDSPDSVCLRLFRAGFEPGLIQLHDVRAGREQLVDLLVDGFGEGHRHTLVVGVVLVDGLLGHGKGTGQCHLDRAIGLRPQELGVTYFNRLGASNGAGNERHLGPAAGASCDFAETAPVNAAERIGHLVGVTLSANLTVGNDVDSRPLLVSNCQNRGIVLSLPQMPFRNAPEFPRTNSRR